MLVGEDRLRFAEREVVFIYADRQMLARIVASTDAVAEIRLGRDDASFFTSGEGRDDQNGWIDATVQRLVPSENADGIAVCLLDTGVNRPMRSWLPFFPLTISTVSIQLTDDDHGHGSEMSGLAFFGDLSATLASTDPLAITFVGEAVKLLPPQGFPATQPQSYGLVTQQAISRPEISRPDRDRIFCMAVTQADVHGPRATSWSATLDTMAFGGGEIDDLRQRLICVSAGNLPDGLQHGDLEDWDSYEIEDPAHAWNVLSVGGYTLKAPSRTKAMNIGSVPLRSARSVLTAGSRRVGTGGCADQAGTGAGSG
ncbi:S8 family peptidase [Novosphingobium panipatense]